MRCSRLQHSLNSIFKNHLRAASVALGPFGRNCRILVSFDGGRIIITSPDTTCDLQAWRMAGYLAW